MPKAGDKFEDKVAVTGIGFSRIGRRLMTDPVVLAVEAAEHAIADAGLTRDDIDGLTTYPGGMLGGGMSRRRDLRDRGRAARSGRRGSTVGSRLRARAAR